MAVEIEVKQLAAQPVLIVRKNVKRREIPAALANIFPAVHGFAMARGIRVAGPPFARYPEMNKPNMLIEAGMPVGEEATGEGSILLDELPGGPAAFLVHEGPYDGLPGAYAALDRWMVENGREAAGAPWESYVTDPGEFPDPRDWKTEVFWPLAIRD